MGIRSPGTRVSCNAEALTGSWEYSYPLQERQGSSLLSQHSSSLGGNPLQVLPLLINEARI